ncbi:hypothetical protein H5410_019861, partial [Solanum commersonii]
LPPITPAPCLLKYVQYLQPEPPATSAVRCLIISMTAALRRESACCCILRKCSFKSLYKGTVNAIGAEHESVQVRSGGIVARDVEIMIDSSRIDLGKTSEISCP